MNSCPVCVLGDVRVNELMCKRCWWTVPKKLRDKVWSTWKRRRNGSSSRIREYIAAHEAAKAAAIAAAKEVRLAKEDAVRSAVREMP